MAQCLGINHSSHLLCNGVGGHGAVLLVGYEHPLAVFSEIEGTLLLLLGELDAEGVLAHVALIPAAIATTTHLTTLHLGNVWPDASAIQLECAIFYPLLLGPDIITFFVIEFHTNPLISVPFCCVLTESDIHGWNLISACSIVGEIFHIHFALTTKGDETV